MEVYVISSSPDDVVSALHVFCWVELEVCYEVSY